MQWSTTSAGLGAISLMEILSIVACSVFLVVALWACLPKGGPSEERPIFDRLLHRVHEQREELFINHHRHRLSRLGSATRQNFLNSTRARLRESPFFHR